MSFVKGSESSARKANKHLWLPISPSRNFHIWQNFFGTAEIRTDTPPSLLSSSYIVDSSFLLCKPCSPPSSTSRQSPFTKDGWWSDTPPSTLWHQSFARLGQRHCEDLALLYPELYKELTKVCVWPQLFPMTYNITNWQGRALSYKTFFQWLMISLYQGK